MASVDKIKREQKKIFNNLSFEEKKAYYKKLSELKFKNLPFISEEGVVKGNKDNYNSIDNLTVEINKDPNLETFLSNASLSVIMDYVTLKEKYDEQLLTALKIYNKSISYDCIIIDNLIYFLEKFLGVFNEEPSELLYNVLQDVAKATIGTFNKAIVEINSDIENLSSLAIEEEDLEVFLMFKDGIEEKTSKYNAVLMEIMNLVLPDGLIL